MLIAAEQGLRGYIGGDCDASFTLYADAGRTTRFPMVGYTAQVYVGDVALPGAQVTLDIPNATVTFNIPAASTTTYKNQQAVPYYVKLTDAAGKVTFPVRGRIVFSLPSPT